MSPTCDTAGFMGVDEITIREDDTAADEAARRRGAILRERREALGISLRAFARRCELSPAHVSKVERGLASPSVATLSRIVQELDLEPALLFGTVASPPTGAPEPIVTRAADVMDLAAETGSPEGSVVRVIARPDTGSVIESIGGPDYFLPPTIAPKDSIFCVLAGTLEVDIEGERFELYAGDSLIVPPFRRFAARVLTGLDTHTLLLSPAGSKLLHGEPAPQP
jgi:transcriptional regulator with XRE-family HTH domain